MIKECYWDGYGMGNSSLVSYMRDEYLFVFVFISVMWVLA